MNRSTFERLVSEWLDRPRRGDLRARIAAAIQDQPVFAQLLKHWQHVDDLLHAALPEPKDVAWTSFRIRLAQSLGNSARCEDRQQRGS